MRHIRGLFLLGAILSGAGSLLLPAFLSSGVLEAPGTGWNQGIVAGVYAQTSSGQAIFDQKCKSCHTIGGGRGVGPDLKGIDARDRQWLVRFIASPEQVIAQGDPIARQLVQEYGLRMPNLGISAAEAEAVLAYIASKSGDGQAPGATAAPTAGGDAATGRALFSGEIPLRNGAGPCISCHNVSGLGGLGGGTLSRDLTTASARLGQGGLTTVLRTTPFPGMAAPFSTRPLTDDEIGHLVAFLAASAGPEAAPPPSQSIFIVVGIAGSLFMAGLFQLFWGRRLCGVRCNLVNGGSK